MVLVKLLYRSLTLAGMQGDEQVITSSVIFLFDADAVAELSQNPRPAHRRYPVAIARPRRRGGYDSDSHQAVGKKLFKSESTSAKTGPNVASIGRIEVAIVIADQPRARDPTAATQHSMIAEPGLRILLVRTGSKTRIRSKCC